MAKIQTCRVCGLPDGHHDFQKHRLAVTPDNVELQKSIRRHPAGSRLPKKDNNNA